MTEVTQPGTVEEDTGKAGTNVSNAKIGYILYMVGLVFGLTAIIGVVMAYTNRKDSNPAWLNSHYTFQIYTFWYGVIYLFVGVLSSLVLIGYFVLLWWVVWVIVRSIKGLSHLDEQKEIKNPGAFFGFGF